MNLFVYDFEVFEYDWTVTFKNILNSQYKVIVNNVEELEDFTKEYLEDVFIGFNNGNYDKYIWDGILSGWNPMEISKRIIDEKTYAWQWYKKFKYRPIQYDILKNLGARQSLKLSEGNLGLEIKESDVDFFVDRKLTIEEIEKVLKYNKKDVDATEELFNQSIGTFRSKLMLLKMFHLPLVYLQKTDAQLTAIILDAHKSNIWKNEIKLSNGKVILDRDYYEVPKNLVLKKYKYIIDGFGNEVPDNWEAKSTLIANVKHVIGLGGLHGDTKSSYYEGLLVILDVESYFPSLMILYNYLSRNVSRPELFSEIKNLRINHKHQFELTKNKLDKEMADALKLIINTTYGALGAEFNEMYDPRMRKSVCISGQLFLIDLIEKLEGHIEEFIQSNTDGIMFKLHSIDDLVKIKEVVDEWEQRTGFKMEWTFGKRMWQKDVNNYIFEQEDGHLKYKGAYVKDKTLDANSAIIVNEAVKQYFVNGILPDDYIERNHPLEKFQFIAKGGTMFNHFYHKIGKEFHQLQKVNRCFATTLPEYGTIYKIKDDKETYERIAGLPEKCIIINDDIRENTTEELESILNYQFYIMSAYKRIGDFLAYGGE